MKFSAAILRGYKTNGGRQCVNELKDAQGRMCVYGAAIEGGATCVERVDSMASFRTHWGFDAIELNNRRMPWEHIYGMARAVGQ